MKVRNRWTAVATTAAVLALTACSSDEPAPEADPPAASTHATAAPTPAPTPTPSPTPISKEQAGAAYLALVAPVNALVTPWNDAIAASDWASLRAQAQPYADANRAFADGLMAAEWPPEAQGAVDGLVAELAADISAFVQVAGTTADADTIATINAFPARGSSAQQLRMILGLENVPAG
jgi:hypothetical protein